MYFHIAFSVHGNFEILLLVSGHGSFCIIKKQVLYCMHWQISLSSCPWYRPLGIHKNPPDRQTTSYLIPPSCSWQTIKSLFLLQTTPVPVPDRPPAILFLTDNRASCSWQITSHSVHENTLAIESVASHQSSCLWQTKINLSRQTRQNDSCQRPTTSSPVSDRPAPLLFLKDRKVSCSWQTISFLPDRATALLSWQTNRSIPDRPADLLFLTYQLLCDS
jgi:hypothetical protein